MKYEMLAITGPTASGKTAVAAGIADKLGGEVLSADSRQVYRGMNLGTGKDYDDYIIGGKQVPYHLIDLVDAGYEYNIFEYQRDFIAAWQDVTGRGKFPVLCGGSGLYIEAALKGYRLVQVPPNQELRNGLVHHSLDELTGILKSYKPELHNTTDIDTIKRAIRAIEIEDYLKTHPEETTEMPEINSLIVGIKCEREIRRRRITIRLKQRLDEGMIDEVKTLIDSGLKPEQLVYYGLEYKYLTLYITGKLSWDEMFSGLEIAIHQFAKRQMTWFRRMERQGTVIHWLDGEMPYEEKHVKIQELLEESY